MKIRIATIKDLKEIAKLFLEYDEYECKLDKNVKKCSLNEIEKDEKEHMEFGTIYFILEEKGKTIGALNVDIDRRGKERIGILHTLIITKEARGNGYGNKLVDYALAYFKKQNCRRVKTFIHIANKNALGFWKNRGFNFEEGYTASKKLK